MLGHLVRRTWYSVRPTKISPEQLREISSTLSPNELALWEQMSKADRAHSLLVLQRFDSSSPHAPREARAGVLLHDVGKIASHLNTPERIIATMIGPRTRRFRQYLDHEAIGKKLLIDIDSDPLTISTASGEGTWGPKLRKADHI